MEYLGGPTLWPSCSWSQWPCAPPCAASGRSSRCTSRTPRCCRCDKARSPGRWCATPWIGDSPAISSLLPSGELTKTYGKSPFFMGKSAISMAIFNCYVSSPEGITPSNVAGIGLQYGKPANMIPSQPSHGADETKGYYPNNDISQYIPTIISSINIPSGNLT